MNQRVSEPANQRTGEQPALFTDLLLTPYALLLVLVLVFAVFFGALAVQQHRAFLTNGLDIGNVDQALWNTAHGRFMEFTLMAPVQSRLALHVEPILLLFVPFYWLGLGGPELLLLVQAAVVAVGAWPLYQLSLVAYRGPHSDEKSANFLAVALLVFPLAYLLLPTLESALLFDFHAITLAPTFLLFAFLALEQRNNRLFFLFVVLAMATKEDMSLVVAMLGLYTGLARQRWRLAAITVALAALWFAAAVFVVQPLAAATGNIQLERYAWLGGSPAEMVSTLITRPDLVLTHLRQVDAAGYLLHLFYPTAFLALLSPLTLLPMLPTLAVNLLSDNPFTWRLEDFHYGAPLAPFLFISAIYGTRWLARRLAQKQSRSAVFNTPSFAAALFLLVLVFSAAYHFQRGFTLLARPFHWPAVTGHHHRLEAVLREIPSDAPLFAQSNLAPHLSQRPVIYTDFAYFTDPDFRAAAPARHILLDVTSFENRGGLHQYLQEALLESGNYQVITATDGILHLAALPSPQPPAVLPPSFFTFARPDSPAQFSLQVNFDDALRLRGYSLHFNRQEEVQVTVDLEPLRPLSDIQPVLYLLDAAGQPVGATTDLPPALVWYPAARWPVGRPVRVRFNTLPWYTRETPAYRLALGVVAGSDPWAVERRLPPVVESSGLLAVRLPAQATLVELARIEQTWRIPGGGPPLRRFSRPAVPHPLAARFANQLELFGYGQPRLTRQPDGRETLSLTLYWQARSTPENLVRFVQLVGPDGQVYGQVDSPPDRGQYPTNLWQPGEVVVERVSFPVTAARPPGDYAVHVGLYRPDTGVRLQLAGGRDHVEIGLRH